MIDTAVILAGGKGLRLHPETLDKPKAMTVVHGRPIIEWMLLWLKKHGVTRAIISVDYKKEGLMSYIKDGGALGISVVYNDHGGCFETGDVFRHVLKHQDLPETFFAMNGDQITDIPLQDLAAHHEKHRPLTTLVTRSVRIPYGILDISETGHITRFREKPILPDTAMNTGIYVFERSILEYLPAQGLIEKETFTKLADMRQLRAYPHTGFYTTISDMKDLAEAEQQLRKTSTELI